MACKLMWDNLVECYIEKVISPFYSEENATKLLSLIIPEISNGRVLDLGCGKGYLLKKLFNNCNDTTILLGTDYSQEMVRYAKKCYNKNVICQSSADYLPYNHSCFDITISINSIIMDEPKIRNRSFEEAFRITKSGGKFIALFPSNENHSEQMFYLKRQFEADGYSEQEAIGLVYDELNERMYDPIGGYINITNEDLRIKLYSKFEIVEILNKTGFKNIKIIPFKYSDTMVDELGLISGINGLYDWYVTASVDK